MPEHETHNTQKGFFTQLSPKAAFLFGLAVAVAVMSLIGFVVMLAFFRSDGPATAKTATNTNVNAAAARLSYRPVSDDDHVRGSKNAEVTLIEYSDLECPFCKRVHPTIQQVMQEYDGKVRWVYRHLPLTSLHPKAINEAYASECAAEQGKFWEYIDMVYERTPANNGLEEAKLTEFAQELGLNLETFTACLDGEKYADQVAADMDDATQAGAQGTPYTLIIDKNEGVTPISGALPYADFKTAIDAALGV